ncbi:MAG: NRAMP family divalent metal transporter [Saprospiraceae bacterium]
MAKMLSVKDRFLSVLFWSVIAAAFIGPGTVTTAAKAGASFQLSLLWALVFSTFATIVLQEAAARITIASGKSLGEIIALKYKGQRGYWIKRIVFIAVAFGCAAYQAGNMLGAVAGMSLLGDVSKPILTLGIALLAGLLLWIGNFRTIANLLGLVVAVMGIAFVSIAMKGDFGVGEILVAAFIPSFPVDAELLIIGLVGTTIVPYNLFLASGISQGQKMSEMRIGIGVAVLIGGLISMAILLVGTQLTGAFSFARLAETMVVQFGDWASVLFGFGLFAAGMTSSITSPFAAAVTARSLFAKSDQTGDVWGAQAINFRLVWGGVLGIGLLFGLSGLQPVATIVFAQAINGILLPVVAIFLFLIVNDPVLLKEKTTGKNYANNKVNNLLMLVIVGLSGFLGMINIVKVLSPTASVMMMVSFAATFTMIVVLYLAMRVFRKE